MATAPSQRQAAAEPLPPEPASRGNRVIHDVEQTSLSARNTDPNVVIVRFTRWTSWGITAYQKGQFAGFQHAEAMRLIAQGHAILAERSAAERLMVTK